MNKLFSTIIFVLIAQIAISQTASQKIVNQLLLPDRGAIFRGYDFYTMEDEIEEFEETVSISEYIYEDIDDDLNLYLGYEFNFDEVNYATVDNFIDLDGIVEVTANIYTETPKLAIDVYHELEKFYTKALGNFEKDSEDWTTYKGTFEGLSYKVFFKVLSDDYGDYVGFDILLE